jgi:hypothetical protein
MPKTHKRKYEKIDEAEIDLVTQCSDSHEFYERYREMFPNKKKGIDSISKIWKRRSEFLKKRQPVWEPDNGLENLQNLESFFLAQNKILAELTAIMKEQLKVSREILARQPKQTEKHEEHIMKPDETPKEIPKKPALDKRNEIMIGS